MAVVPNRKVATGWWWWLQWSSILAVVAVAVYLQQFHHESMGAMVWMLHGNTPLENKDDTTTTTATETPLLSRDIYVIGDLHGDAHCARHWVERTGLVAVVDDDDDKDEDEDTRHWRWTNPNSHLVFLGDYVDKGITSRQTVEYVKRLTDAFPTTVTALMGNHELELLRDRTEQIWNGVGYFQLPYATVHPSEYLNYLPLVDEVDRRVVEALYNATLEVYGQGLRRSVRFAPLTTTDEENDTGMDEGDSAAKTTTTTKSPRSIVELVEPDSFRETVDQRLRVYQAAYLDAYRIAAVLDDTIFVHGGLPKALTTLHFSTDDVHSLNHALATHATEDKLASFLDTTRVGQTVYRLLVERGNHEADACTWLPDVLPEGVTRLAVGHTPAGTVRMQCEGSFLALDSALSRWFRNSGNDYCHGKEVQSSRNGAYTCRRATLDECQGQIVKLTEGHVEVIS